VHPVLASPRDVRSRIPQVPQIDRRSPRITFTFPASTKYPPGSGRRGCSHARPLERKNDAGNDASVSTCAIQAPCLLSVDRSVPIINP
jgi:hypothetical protein